MITSEDWKKLHNKCPRCRSNKYYVTLIDPIWDIEKDYEDNFNTFQCENCGRKGYIKELVN